MKTIEELRRAGYKVTVNHYRYPQVANPDMSNSQVKKLECEMDNAHFLQESGAGLSPFGGETIVELVTPSGMIAITAISRCNIKDNFNKKMGIKIALNRALSQLQR